MIYLGIACVFGAAFIWLMFYSAGETVSDFVEGLCTILGVIACLGELIAIVAFVVCGFGYHAAQYKADIINREYGTEYTNKEIFYACDVIDIIRELDRKRIEINGDVMGGNR